MNQKTAEALQMAGQLLAEQLGHPKGKVIEITVCNPCDHKWDFGDDETITCKNCGLTDFVGGDGDDDDWCDNCNGIGCEECDEDYWLGECGKLPNGICMKAGSEECDFECPFRDN